jgi:hypothetical protein
VSASHRSIIETDRFVREKQAIEPNAQLLDAALRGATWTLARNPQSGQPTVAPTVWAIPTNAMLGVPALVIYYCFDDDTVTLLSVEIAASGPFTP